MQTKKQNIWFSFSLGILASLALVTSPLPSHSRTNQKGLSVAKQESTEALILQSFMSKKSIVEQFFAASPVLAEIQEDSRTTSGLSVYMRRITGVVSDFDLAKTDSLISPYHGYVVIDYSEDLCGLTPEASSSYASSDFITEVEALRAINDCPYWQENLSDRSYDKKLSFEFEYSGGSWTIVNIERYFEGKKAATDPGFDLAFYPELPPTRGRKQVTNERLIQNNSIWNDLINSLLN